VSKRIPTGKLPAALLEELLAGLPALPPEVRLGPAIGEDACAIDVPAGTLVAATDPITLTGEAVGAHAVLINANDVAVMGVRPRWFLAAVMLPEGTTEDDVRALFRATRAALGAADVALVGGHTEVTAAVRQPVVVGQMLGFAEDGRVIATGGARPGDRIVQAGPAPVEGAALLATGARERLGALPPRTLQRAARGLEEPGISVVRAALLAARLGAHALHDPTEGGLAAGLVELAGASQLALTVDAGAVLWFEPGLAICEALGADPWCTLASGALLAAFPPDLADAACAELSQAGTPARIIATAREGQGVHLQDGRPLPAPPRDELSRLL
jgi:hydrogenase maturation factor